MKPITAFLLLVATLLSCLSSKQQKVDISKKFSPSNNIAKGKTIAADSTKSDAFSCQYIFRSSDTIYTKLQYGGGCGTVQFFLRKKEDTKKTSTYEIICRKNDLCKSLITKEIYFIIDKDANNKTLTILANGNKVL